VKVNEHAGPQGGQDVEHDAVDVAVELDGVGRVDEQDVARAERREDF